MSRCYTTEAFANLEEGEAFDLELALTNESDGLPTDITSSIFSWEVKNKAGSTVVSKTIVSGIAKAGDPTTGILYIQLREADYSGLNAGERYTHKLWWDRLGDSTHQRPLMAGIFKFGDAGVDTLP